MEDLVKKWRGRPQIGEQFEEAADQKRSYDIVPTAAEDTRKVTLTDGTMAFQSKIEGSARNTLPFTHNFVRFMYREIQTEEDPDARRLSPSDLSAIHSPCCIVGWTLSIRTKRQVAMIFPVISGGILESNLTIDIKVPTFHQADWCCRIYYVNRDGYNFPDLTPEWIVGELYVYFTE
jgi:hypothetical protein